MLVANSRRREHVIVRNARVLDPVGGMDETLDVRVDGGIVSALGYGLDTNEHHVIEGEGKALAPAFVDPHVHLRTPGREDEEDLDLEEDLELEEDLDLDEEPEEEPEGELEEEADEEPEAAEDVDEDVEEAEEDVDEELEDEESEESLEVLLGTDAEEEVEEEPRTRSLSKAAATPIGEGEFTCRSCFLVKRRAQLADEKRMICLDCA
jgi:hypothetical protein